jgi:hypothetical protein
MSHLRICVASTLKDSLEKEITSVGGGVILGHAQQRPVGGGVTVEHELALEAHGLHQAHLVGPNMALQRRLKREGLVVCSTVAASQILQDRENHQAECFVQRHTLEGCRKAFLHALGIPDSHGTQQSGTEGIAEPQ